MAAPGARRWQRALPALPFAVLAPVVWWVFSDPTRIAAAARGTAQLLPAWVFLGPLLILAAALTWQRRKAKPVGAGACGTCGWVDDLNGHEGGHLTVSEDLGYEVPGAVANHKEGWGFTYVPGWTQNPYHAMVIAAAGRSGENKNRWIFKVPLNGSKSDGFSDAWWIHQLAPIVAKERGITPAEAIQQAMDEADRRLDKNLSRWRWATAQLAEHGQIGEVSS